jgi:hypothetical protein
MSVSTSNKERFQSNHLRVEILKAAPRTPLSLVMMSVFPGSRQRGDSALSLCVFRKM